MLNTYADGSSQLKPPCVKLSHAALSLQGRGGNVKDVTKCLDDVFTALKSVSAMPDILNEKLADYVFFPLSHVLRQLEKLPVRAKELTLDCIFVLLRTAWKSQIAPPLGVQLLILLSFLADQQELKSKGQQSSEELQALTFTCIEAVFQSLSESSDGGRAILAVDNVPHLAKTVAVILDGVYDGSSTDVRLAAISALKAFCGAVTDREALGSSFFPGIMSCLTKVLTPNSKIKRSHKLLIRIFEVLTQLLPFVLGDRYTRDLPDSEDGKTTRLTKSWLKATAPQVKMALTNIIKIRLHDQRTVRQALAKLCLMLMQECRESLSESMPMLLETLIAITNSDEATTAEVKTLLTVDPSFLESLRTSLHSWSISMPRIMLQAEEAAKQRLIHQISTGLRLISEQEMDLSILDNAMATNLRDTVSNAIVAPKAGIQVADTGAPMDLQHASPHTSLLAFEPVMALQKAQEETIVGISDLIGQLGATDAALQLAQALIPSLYNSSGDSQLASAWISLNLIRKSCTVSSPIDSFLNLDTTASSLRDDLLEELYSFSVAILSGGTDVEHDWRLQALALEILAEQAGQLKLDYRDELVDSLYSVVHLVGSPNPHLRNHAIVCLNLLARACGYHSTGDMIVQNVDYLVNAVAIRLNTFDISPQAPQVLLMMVKMAGPSLLPYLDDLVDSVFAALESFHGYPKLVSLLFSALKVIVVEGAKAPQLAITKGRRDTKYEKPACIPDAVDSVVAMLTTRRKMKAKLDEKMEQTIQGNSHTFPESYLSAHPRQEVDIEQPKEPEPVQSEHAKPGQMQPNDDESLETQPPIPKTYRLLLNISKLTQHYLTFASPELRASLLSLLNTTIPALAKHENSFLPLVHTLWPVLVPRLDDPEAYVVAGAFEVIGMMCVYAGDFMKGRIEELWPIIEKTYSQRTGKAGRKPATVLTSSGRQPLTVVSTVGSRDITQPDESHYYVEAPARILWNGLVGLLIRISSHVAVTDEIYDEILQILLPVVDSRVDVRDALEGRNPDAVWLALIRAKQHPRTQASQTPQEINEKPRLADATFLFAEVV